MPYRGDIAVMNGSCNVSSIELWSFVAAADEAYIVWVRWRGDCYERWLHWPAGIAASCRRVRHGESNRWPLRTCCTDARLGSQTSRNEEGQSSNAAYSARQCSLSWESGRIFSFLRFNVHFPSQPGLASSPGFVPLEQHFWGLSGTGFYRHWRKCKVLISTPVKPWLASFFIHHWTGVKGNLALFLYTCYLDQEDHLACNKQLQQPTQLSWILRELWVKTG